MSGTTTAAERVLYVPLDQRRRGGVYAARRALFLQSYRFVSFPADDGGPEEEGSVLRAGAGLVRAWSGWRPRAGLARAWRGWRPRAGLTLLGCFGRRPDHRRHKFYLHDHA